jgi:hypothetical protein
LRSILRWYSQHLPGRTKKNHEKPERITEFWKEKWKWIQSMSADLYIATMVIVRTFIHEQDNMWHCSHLGQRTVLPLPVVQCT